MALALGATAIVALLCSAQLGAGRLVSLRLRLRAAVARHWQVGRRPSATPYDPGRERRAEQRARALLRSCVNDEEWAMYRDLGFLRVWGAVGSSDAGTPGGRYGYLIYPHRPIVAYLADSGAILNEYCVALHSPHWDAGQARLPDSDDVLAKWMLLTADERQLLDQANMHLPGRQVDPDQVRGDLARLARWEDERRGSGGGLQLAYGAPAPAGGSVPAP
jgi:hypothetical protein